jgi:hypothetical protein
MAIGQSLANKNSKIHLQNSNLYYYKDKCLYMLVYIILCTIFSFKFAKTYLDMLNREFNFQNIYKRESSKISNTYFCLGKHQFEVKRLQNE